MKDLRVKRHPTLGILVRADGFVLVPESGTHPAHWTFGGNSGNGYKRIRSAGQYYFCHRLVVETFIGEIPKDCEVDHINRNRSDNRVCNLRIVTRSENSRNTSAHDRVDARGGIHTYEGRKQYNDEYREEHQDWVHENGARYRAKNRDKLREMYARYRRTNKDRVHESDVRYREARRKTHKCVMFANGKQRWLPYKEAEELLKIPLKRRVLEEA